MIKVKTISIKDYGKLVIALRIDKITVVKLKDMCRITEIDTNEAREKLGEGNLEHIEVSNKDTLFTSIVNFKERCLSLSKSEIADIAIEAILIRVNKEGLTLSDFENDPTFEEMRLILQNKELEISTLKSEIEESKFKVLTAESLFGKTVPTALNNIFSVIRYKNITINSMYELLRGAGILNEYNHPTQRYIDNGSFRMIKTEVQRQDKTTIVINVFVYKKGIRLIEDTLKKTAGDKNGR